MKKNSKVYIVYMLLFTLFIFLASIITKLAENNLKEKGRITYGRFLASKLFKGSTSIEFEYEVNGILYSETNYSIYQVYKSQEILKGKLFPIIYEPQNPENSKMLISESNFEEFDRIRPDSLKWLCSSAGICE